MSLRADLTDQVDCLMSGAHFSQVHKLRVTGIPSLRGVVKRVGPDVFSSITLIIYSCLEAFIE